MSRIQRLAVVLSLNLVLVAGLVAVGITAHSLAVFAEGGDYLLDGVGVAVAMFAIWLSARPARRRRSDGHLNATTVAALINAGWLFTLELLVAAGAVDRLLTRTPHVAGLPVLIVSAIAAVVMTIGALVLRADDDDDDNGDLSVAAVLLDTVADAAAAAGVAITGAIILAARGLFWLDPAVALAVAIVISWHAIALIRKALAHRPGRAAAFQTLHEDLDEPMSVSQSHSFGHAHPELLELADHQLRHPGLNGDIQSLTALAGTH